MNKTIRNRLENNLEGMIISAAAFFKIDTRYNSVKFKVTICLNENSTKIKEDLRVEVYNIESRELNNGLSNKLTIYINNIINPEKDLFRRYLYLDYLNIHSDKDVICLERELFNKNELIITRKNFDYKPIVKNKELYSNLLSSIKNKYENKNGFKKVFSSAFFKAGSFFEKDLPVKQFIFEKDMENGLGDILIVNFDYHKNTLTFLHKEGVNFSSDINAIFYFIVNEYRKITLKYRFY